jgi:hypothetical protein
MREIYFKKLTMKWFWTFLSTSSEGKT